MHRAPSSHMQSQYLANVVAAFLFDAACEHDKNILKIWNIQAKIQHDCQKAFSFRKGEGFAP